MVPRPDAGIRIKNGAGNGARTRHLSLGKAALYQMSYSRDASVIIAISGPFVNHYFRNLADFFLAYRFMRYRLVIKLPSLRWMVFAGITPRTQDVG